jgi:hypothetical protein
MFIEAANAFKMQGLSMSGRHDDGHGTTQD